MGPWSLYVDRLGYRVDWCLEGQPDVSDGRDGVGLYGVGFWQSTRMNVQTRAGCHCLLGNLLNNPTQANPLAYPITPSQSRSFTLLSKAESQNPTKVRRSLALKERSDKPKRTPRALGTSGAFTCSDSPPFVSARPVTVGPVVACLVWCCCHQFVAPDCLIGLGERERILSVSVPSVLSYSAASCPLTLTRSSPPPVVLARTLFRSTSRSFHRNAFWATNLLNRHDDLYSM